MKRGARVLIVVGPARGVAQHCCRLAKVFEERGYQPRVITGSALKGNLDDFGLAEQVGYYDELNIDYGKASSYFDETCTSKRIADVLGVLGQERKRGSIDLIVSKYHVAPLIYGRVFGIPHAYFYTDGPCFLSAKYTPQNNISEKVRSLASFGSLLEDLGIRQEYSSFEEFLSDNTFNIVRGTPLSEGFKAGAPLLRQTKSYYIGTMLTNTKVPLHSVSLKIKVLCSLGTVFNDYTKLFDFLRQVPEEFEFHVGANCEVSEELKSKSNIKVSPYLPVENLLREVDVCLHHGGHGTMLESLRAGVPQIICAQNQSTAQALHGKHIESLGLGSLCELSARDSASQIFSEIKRVSEASYQRRAREVAEVVSQECEDLTENFFEGLRFLVRSRPQGGVDAAAR